MGVSGSRSETTGTGGGGGPITGLAGIVGAEHVTDRADRLAAYFDRPAGTGGFLAVAPGTTEEVRGVVRLAGDLGIPILTLNDRVLRSEEGPREGIILDFRRLAALEKLDPRNLLAHVQRGLTFAELKKALAPHNLKIATPVGATSDSVLCNFVNRAPLKKASLFSEVNVFTMQVVLADGTLFRTGSHALNENVDMREDGGPSLSRWFFGSEDIFGVVTRATIWLYPQTECRDALLMGFERLDDAVRALRNAPRTELGFEFLAANRRFLAHLLGEDPAGLPPWTLIAGFDAQEKLVAYQREKLQPILQEMGGQPLERHRQRMASLLDEVWYQASPVHTGFYTPCNRIKEFGDLANRHVAQAGISQEEVGHCLLAVDRARCVYSQVDVFAEAAAGRGFLTPLEKELAGRGAFFDRPQGELADFVLDRIPNLRTHIRTIKAVMDPRGILNPGRYVSQQGPVFEPLKVELETREDTGIEEENIKAVEEKLKEAVGAEWVTANPADLSSYGRDFTIYSGERPNIVVLPASTAEVQAVMRIAYAYKIPVVPLTTGFNHGGLTIPRKGGILVDLKRLDRLIEIDEETLTATFEPGVRMRPLWFECQKVKTFLDLELKPILPLTLASISLLSNYVSRGGPGTAVKYGGGPDLTVNMTWVLPNGEILRTGPSSHPGTGPLGVHWGPGPDIGGMFFNADGAFGICTEITVKLYPEMPCELIIHTAVFEEDPGGCEKACRTIYDLAQNNLVEFMYKSHPGVMCVTLAGAVDTNPMDLVAVAPKHPLEIIVTGMDEREIAVRTELVRELLARNEVDEIDPGMFGPAMTEMISTDPMKMSVGIKSNTVGAYRGAFQWQAGYIKVEDVPKINQEYRKLVRKYWKTSDVKVSMEMSMTGTDIQGPLPYARVGTVEFDYWWDQGNPESVKRAGAMIRKTSELMFNHGAIPIRNMFGFGELLLPRLRVYGDILKKVRQTFDPANLMHPDVLPITEDYV